MYNKFPFNLDIQKLRANLTDAEFRRILVHAIPHSEPNCGECGKQLTAVRPGKHQCDYCELNSELLQLRAERDSLKKELEVMMHNNQNQAVV
jgi:hypothetical protein